MAADRPTYIARGRYEAPKHWMNFGKGERLSQFDRYVFFTPAPLYIHGQFDDRPLVDFLAQTKKVAHFMHHLFDKPIFEGLDTPNGNKDWNRALWAMEADAWPEFESFMLAVTPFDLARRSVWRVGAQDLDVLDPLWASKHAVVAADAPVARVVALGVDGTEGQIGFQAPADPRVGRPALRRWPPQPKTIAFAKLLFAGMNPALAIDPPVVLPERGVDRLRVRDISEFSAPKQAEYRQAIADALKWKDLK